MKFQTELVEHKSCQKMHFWLPWWYFGRQHDVKIIFRSSVGLKFGNFSFWSYEAETWWRGAFLSGMLELLLKTTDKRQFDVKNKYFYGFSMVFIWVVLKMWLPWQQARVYTYKSNFKILPIHVGESPKVPGQESLTVLHIFIQKPQKVEKHPPPYRVKRLQCKKSKSYVR